MEENVKSRKPEAISSLSKNETDNFVKVRPIRESSREKVFKHVDFFILGRTLVSPVITTSAALTNTRRNRKAKLWKTRSKNAQSLTQYRHFTYIV